MTQIKHAYRRWPLLLLLTVVASCNFFKPLNQRLISDDDKVRIKALQKIVTLPPEKKTDLAHTMIVYFHNPDGRVVSRAADAIVLLGPSAVDDLRKVVGDPDVFVRLTAVAAIGRLGRAAKTMLPELMVCLTDIHPLVREEAANALGQMGTDGSPAANSLLQALNDPNPDVRSASAEALKKMGIRPPPAGRRAGSRIS